MQRGYVQALVRQCDRNPAAALKNEDFRSIGGRSGRKRNISDGGQRHATRLSSSCRSDNCFSGPNFGRTVRGRASGNQAASRPKLFMRLLPRIFSRKPPGGRRAPKKSIPVEVCGEPGPKWCQYARRTASSRRIALENLRTHAVPSHFDSKALI